MPVAMQKAWLIDQFRACRPASCLIARTGRNKASLLVNDSRDAGIGSSEYPALLFNGTQAGQIEMLPARRCLSEPAVIADINEQIGTLTDALLGKPGENAFVADKHAGSHFAIAQGPAIVPLGIDTDTLQQGFEKVKVQEGRGIFTKGYEMLFIVLASVFALIVEKNGSIIDAARIAGSSSAWGS